MTEAVRPEAVDALARVMRGPFSGGGMAAYVEAQQRAADLTPFTEAEHDAAGSLALTAQEIDSAEEIRRAELLAFLARCVPGATVDDAIAALSDEQLAQFLRMADGDPPS